MAQEPPTPRLLAPNSRAIDKAVKASARHGPLELRIEGARGLVLIVLPSGTATWYFYYDALQGRRRKRRKFKIGRLDEVSLAQATREAERLRPMIRQGLDPAREGAEQRKAMTFEDLACLRLEKGDPLRPNTLRDYRHVLGKDILPAVGDKPAKGVTREDIVEILDQMTTRGATRRADTARAVISSIFGYGMDRGLVTANPTAKLRNRHMYQPREVIATKDDIRQLSAALDTGDAAMSPAVAVIVKLALLTGLRRTEIAAIRKSELDLDGPAPMLTIPRGRAKNRNTHRVPLSPQAANLLRQALTASGDSEYLFAAAQPDRHIAARSVSKAMERTRAKIGIKDITMHDLRRTAGTYMSQFGVPRDVRERILNHGGSRKGNVTDGVYNHYEYDAEKRAALELWADALDGIISGSQREIDSYAVRLARLKGADKILVG